MRQLRRFVLFVCLVGVLFVSFISSVFSVDIFDYPAGFASNQTNIADFIGHIGTGNYSKTDTNSLRIVDSVGASNIFYTPLHGIIAGKTYIITGTMAFGQNSGRIKLGMSINSVSDSSIPAFDFDNSNYWVIDDSTLNQVNTFSYTFLPRFSQVNGISNNLQAYYMVEITQQVSTITLRLRDLQCICIDDIVVKHLQTIIDDDQTLQATVESIVDELVSLNDAALQRNQNLVNIAQRISIIYDVLKDEYREFEDYYGQAFTIALYNLISEALGADKEPIEFETDPALGNQVSDYVAAESELMQDNSAGLSQVFSDSGAVLTGNNAFEFIRDTLDSLLFSDNKLTAFVMFSLSFGLIVLVIGRRVHV